MGYDGFQSMSQAPPVAAVASTATRRSQMLSALPQMDQVGEHYSVTHAHTRNTNYISCMEFMRANPLSKSHEFAKGSDFVLWSTLALGKTYCPLHVKPLFDFGSIPDFNLQPCVLGCTDFAAFFRSEF
jgi:hypothetical protein